MYVVDTPSAVIVFIHQLAEKESVENTKERKKENEMRIKNHDNERGEIHLYNIKSIWNWIENVPLLFNMFLVLRIFIRFFPLLVLFVRSFVGSLRNYLYNKRTERNQKQNLKILTG